MSCILSSVFVCHEVLLVSSFSVISRAVSSGTEVNKETTSKEIMISSGSTWISFIFDRKALTFLTENIYIYIYYYIQNKKPRPKEIRIYNFKFSTACNSLRQKLSPIKSNKSLIYPMCKLIRNSNYKMVNTNALVLLLHEVVMTIKSPLVG